MSGPHYGPGSYYEAGRVYPRDRLREPFRRLGRTVRRWLGCLLGPGPGVAPQPCRLIGLVGTVTTLRTLAGTSADLRGVADLVSSPASLLLLGLDSSAPLFITLGLGGSAGGAVGGVVVSLTGTETTRKELTGTCCEC